jgi:hypothetical protein
MAALMAAGLGAPRLQAAATGSEVPFSLRSGQPPDGAWPVVEQRLRSPTVTPDGVVSDEVENWLNHLIELGEAGSRAEALAVFFQYDVYWGYADLDGEGAEEMIVWVGMPVQCGSAGCQTMILQRRGSSWEIVLIFMLEEPTGDLCYTRAGPDGFPMIRSRREAVWWTGNEFDSICYLACMGWGDPYGTTPEELATMTPAEFRIRDQLRRLPWCGAS